ncbi:alpha/beta fold hydrolase [Candidatus Enterococcus mansonii]|uniref:AB hydrolase-1 domain-containing protein n=1 Tax=Candidatus Enterococcus mansonii TaxID=1834181 RepID=A0A242CI33_9ENTE|nr:alpha/beta hydrolase [Enterococcus sp. 4G2_DIV0659]OTO09570.1 hypothetical protein A5880_000249 [Enterococcus sp. 4G2_DIV0659]
MPILKTKSATIYYESQGSGPHILLIHAGIADSRMWSYEFQALATQFHVTRFDLPGFGQSSFTGEVFSYTMMINELLDHLAIDQTYLFAASFGGKLALDFAIEMPNRTLGMTLQSPAIGDWAFSDELQQYDAQEEELLNQKSYEQAAQLNYETWILRNRQPDTIDSQLKALIINMQMTAFTKLEIELPVEETPDSSKRSSCLDQLCVPTLVLIGSEDVPDFQQIADFLHKTIPLAEKIIVPHAAHLANLEAPVFVEHSVIPFFSKLIDNH